MNGRFCQRLSVCCDGSDGAYGAAGRVFVCVCQLQRRGNCLVATSHCFRAGLKTVWPWPWNTTSADKREVSAVCMCMCSSQLHQETFFFTLLPLYFSSPFHTLSLSLSPSLSLSNTQINGVDVSSLDLPDILALLEVDQSPKIKLTLHRDLSMTLL